MPAVGVVGDRARVQRFARSVLELHGHLARAERVDRVARLVLRDLLDGAVVAHRDGGVAERAVQQRARLAVGAGGPDRLPARVVGGDRPARDRVAGLIGEGRDDSALDQVVSSADAHRHLTAIEGDPDVARQVFLARLRELVPRVARPVERLAVLHRQAPRLEDDVRRRCADHNPVALFARVVVMHREAVAAGQHLQLDFAAGGLGDVVPATRVVVRGARIKRVAVGVLQLHAHSARLEDHCAARAAHALIVQLLALAFVVHREAVMARQHLHVNFAAHVRRADFVPATRVVVRRTAFHPGAT